MKSADLMYFIIYVNHSRLVVSKRKKEEMEERPNKAVYTAALVADGWAGAKNLLKTT